MLRPIGVGLALVTIACGSSTSPYYSAGPSAKPGASSSAAAAAGSATALAPEKPNDPAASRPKIDPAATPVYARVDGAVDIEYPDRVRLARAGRFAVEWPDADQETSDEKKVDWEPPVLEASVGAKPYRVLCREPEHQIAVYAPGSSLATVAREPVVLHPKTNPPEQADDKEPGARIARGAVLTVLGTINPVDHLRFDSIGLSVDGFARRVQLGPMFRREREERNATPLRYDAELAGAEGVMLPEPNKTAKPLAKLTPYPEGQGVHRFQRLGTKRGSFSLVRLLHPETTVVGWIDDASLKLSSGQVTFEKEQKLGGGKLRGPKMMPIKRGTVLLSPQTKTPVGVVLGDMETPCVKRCESDEPLLAIRACGGVARALPAK